MATISPSSSRPRPRQRLRISSSYNGTHVEEVHSPIPDLQTLCGAYLKNIEKLEQSAEELSQGGSDIGEEIRRMKQDQDSRDRDRDREASASRRSSLVSSLSLSLPPPPPPPASASTASPDNGSHSSSLRSRPSDISSNRGRNASFANSIVDVNVAARWGGYSPGGFVTSPPVSRVSSFHRPAGMPEPVWEGRPLESGMAVVESGVLPSRRLSQRLVVETDDMMAEQMVYAGGDQKEREEQERERWEMDTRRGLLQGEEPHSDEQNHEEQQYEEQHHEERHHEERHHEERHLQQDDAEHGLLQSQDTPVMERSSTPDTYRQARSLFNDFDGTHYSSAAEEGTQLDNHVRDTHQPISLDTEVQETPHQTQAAPVGQRRNLPQNHMSRMSTIPRPLSRANFPPGENMTYYPAPVPRILNLPKRLSQLPAASARVQRPAQIAHPLPAEPRQSAMWLPALDFQIDGAGEADHSSKDRPLQSKTHPTSQNPASPNQRQSIVDPLRSQMSLANMPPQLRASVYFDQPNVRPEIKLGQSAGATLDSMLAASVTAPVNVFIDHPFVGSIGNEAVYGKPDTSNNRRTTLIGLAKSADPTVSDPAAENVAPRRRASGASVPLQARNSIASMFTDFGSSHKLNKRNSKLSFATDLGLSRGGDVAYTHGESEQQAAEDQGESVSLQSPDQNSAAEDEDYEEEQFNEKYPFFAQPTTLLAELQARKTAQKTRNRTAWTSGGSGMHSTLLQMDAVAEIEKAKKQKRRTRLVWEDPGLDEYEQKDDQDEDIPLGVLYPERDGLANRAGGKAAGQSDWNKPLGLLEKRELEDNEPLAQRRNRLRGISPDHHLRIRAQRQTLIRQQREAEIAAATIPLPSDEDEDEPAGESLADRLRRLKRKTALDVALGDIANGDETRRKSTFSDDLLGQFGATKTEGETPKDEPKFEGHAPATTSQQPVPQNQNNAESETLAQRRARLQRERSSVATIAAPAQRNVSDPASSNTLRPPLHRASSSLANLLAAHPVISSSPILHNSSYPTHSHPPGSLLAASAVAELEAKNKLREQNTRSVSRNGLAQPTAALPTSNKRSSRVSVPVVDEGLEYQRRVREMQEELMRMQLVMQLRLGDVLLRSQQQQQQQHQNSQYPQQQSQYPQQGVVNPRWSQYGSGVHQIGQQQQQQQHEQQIQRHSQQMPAFAQPTAQYGLLQQQQQGLYGNMGQMHLWNGGLGTQQAVTSQQGYAMSAGIGAAGVGAGVGVGARDVQDNPRDRALIDRWRLSVAQ